MLCSRMPFHVHLQPLGQNADSTLLDCIALHLHDCMGLLQRYSQTNVLKRTIFELIAEEIIKRMTQQHIDASPDPSGHYEGSHSLPNE